MDAYISQNTDHTDLWSTLADSLENMSEYLKGDLMRSPKILKNWLRICNLMFSLESPLKFSDTFSKLSVLGDIGVESFKTPEKVHYHEPRVKIEL